MGLLATHARVFSCCCVWILCIVSLLGDSLPCSCFPTDACLTIAAADFEARSSRRGIRASHGCTLCAPWQNITSIPAMQVLRSLHFDCDSGGASEDRVICMHSAFKKSNSSKQRREREEYNDRQSRVSRATGWYVRRRYSTPHRPAAAPADAISPHRPWNIKIS